MLRLFAFTLLFVALAKTPATAQESVRLSLAGEQTAEARRKAASSTDFYNLRLGPTAWRFEPGLGLEASDNIRLENAAPQADVIFRPEIKAHMTCPVSTANSINLSLGAGYSAYAQHSEFNRWFVTPGTELSFDLYAGDFWINFHDRLSVLENSYQDPTVVGVADYAQLQNVAGVRPTWALNKLTVQVGYDHVNYVELSGNDGGGGGGTDGQSEVFSSALGYAFEGGATTGLELGGSLIHFDASGPNQSFTDAAEWSVGWFSEAQLSQYISVRGRIGYTQFLPEPILPGEPATDFTGLYLQIAAAHRLNQYLDYTLSGGRNLNFTFYGGTVDLSAANLALNWRILHKINLTTSFEFEHGSQFGSGAETFNRYGPGVSLSRLITQKLLASLGYRFYNRDSNLPDRDYVVNIASVDVRYQF